MVEPGQLLDQRLARASSLLAEDILQVDLANLSRKGTVYVIRSALFWALAHL